MINLASSPPLLWCSVDTVLSDLKWRGLVALSTDEAALAEHLSAGPVTFYVGFDPTAPSLHLGNLVQLMAARGPAASRAHAVRFWSAGDRMIGDPKDDRRADPQPQCDSGQGLGGKRSAAGRAFLSTSRAELRTMVNNSTGPRPMSMIDFLRDIGKHFPVNRMLARDVVRHRLEAGISYTEFSYVLLQSMDYLKLFRDYGVHAAVRRQRPVGQHHRRSRADPAVDGARVHAFAHAACSPRPTARSSARPRAERSGSTRQMTSPYALHQFWLNVEDEKVIEYLKVFSERSRAEIEDLERQTKEAPHLRAAQRALADDVTELVHSEADRDAAVAAANALFGRDDLRELSEPTLAAVVAEIGGVALTANEQLPQIVDVFERSGVVSSKAAARRAIAEGGAYLNNVRVQDQEAVLTRADLLHGRFAILRRGKRTVGAVTVTVSE